MNLLIISSVYFERTIGKFLLRHCAIELLPATACVVLATTFSTGTVIKAARKFYFF